MARNRKTQGAHSPDDGADDTDLHGEGGQGETAPEDNPGIAATDPAPTDQGRANAGIPPEPPADDQLPTARPDVPGAADALAAVDAEVARLKSENADLRSRLVAAGLAPADDQPDPDAHKPRWHVSGPGLPDAHVHADDEAAAIEAFKRKHGMWAIPVRPTVVPHEPPAGVND